MATSLFTGLSMLSAVFVLSGTIFFISYPNPFDFIPIQFGLFLLGFLGLFKFIAKSTRKGGTPPVTRDLDNKIPRPDFSHNKILASFSVFGIFALAIAQIYMPQVQKPSLKSIALYINEHRQPGDKVVAFDSYFQDLPVYTQQVVTVVNALSELEFGTTVEDTSAWMIQQDKFIAWWRNGKRLWIVARKTTFNQFIQGHQDLHYNTIKDDGFFVLVRNR